MKLYAHWDGDQPFTKVLKVDDKGTIADLRDACWSVLIAQHPGLAASGSASVRLSDADRRPLPLSSFLADVVSVGDDVFFNVSGAAVAVGFQTADTGGGSKVSESKGHAAASTAAQNAPAAEVSPPAAPGRTDNRTVDTAQGVGKPRGSDSQLAPADPLLPMVRSLWLRAEATSSQRNYRAAAETLQQALLLAPEPAASAHVSTLQRLARLWLTAGNPGAAVRWALQAAEQRPEDPEVLELAGDCLREGGRPREAAIHYQSALDALEESAAQAPSSSRLRDGDDVDSAPSTTQLRLRLSLAACLHRIPGCITPPYDNQDLAASLVMAVLERDPGHWDALRLYGRIALDRGIRDDALRVALRLVVGRPQHAGAKALLAECLEDEEGCRQLFEELGVPPPAKAGPTADGPGGSSGSGATAGGAGGSGSSGGSSTAAALGFIATAIKDHGKVDSCISLLQRAVQMDTTSASYCLNLVHALELRQELQAAVASGRSYCRRAGSVLAGLALKDVDSLLSDLPELSNAVQLTWLHSEPRWSPLQRRCGGGGEEGLAGGSEGSELGGGGGEGGGQAVKVSYSSDQLDELALLFTLAKVLFVGGALTAAARLCDLVEPLGRASATELHTTLVRNEAAYFGCVVQLLRDHPPPPAPVTAAAPEQPPAPAVAFAASGSLAPLYLCGDSHCLSASWRLVALRGEQRLLRPLLVTGCKVWHLRPRSEFYPKKQFEATIRLLPDGAQVVLVLGEIDCREGLLLAVQKGKYDSVAEGIDATISIYMDVMRTLVSERSMELFVHPVPPVLNETRHIVVPFAAALRRAVEAARAAEPVLQSRLHYLDFFDQLLAPRPDGTTAKSIRSRSATAAGAPVEAAVAGKGVASEKVVAAAVGPQPEAVGAEGPGTGQVSDASAAAVSETAAASWALRPDLVFDGTHLGPLYLPLLDVALREVR